jgi:integrase
MATISQRRHGDGHGYQVRYYAPDGSRRSRTFPTKSEAKAFATKVEADKVRGEWHDPRMGQTCLSEFVAAYSNTLVHLRASSRLKVEGHLRNYVLPAFGHFKIADIRPADVRAWVSAMLAHGLSPATVRAVAATFSRVMNQALVDGAITRSPLLGLQLPKNGHSPEMKVLEPRQIRALAETVDPHFRTLIFMAAYTGLRWSELAASNVSSVDLASAAVHVRESLVEVNGKLCLGSTKTGATRKVALPRFLVEMLEPQVRGQAPDGYVFTSKEGGPLRRNFYKRHYLPALKASVDPHLCLCDSASCSERHTPLYRFHDLRHTCAALLIAQGAHPKEIQERLGHSTIRMTFDRYGHLFPTLDERLRDGLDQLYAGSAPGA